MKPKHIFIVGLPRTGTKLITNILESSPTFRCKISPENFFLGHFISPGLREKLKDIGDMSNDENVRKFVDYIYSDQAVGTYWDLLKEGYLKIDRAEFLQEILNSDRSDKGIYEAIMKAHPVVTEDTILGDKTPGHLYHVPTLMEWFPEAKVIHTFRDPRAILASEWQKRMSSKPSGFFHTLMGPLYSFKVVLHVTITWLYAVRLHYKYQKQYPQNYYLSKFEDVVSDSEASAQELCKFLNVEFHPTMLNPRQVDSSYVTDKSSGGIDKSTLWRWKTYLKPWMNTWLLLWGRKYLREFGYIR